MKTGLHLVKIKGIFKAYTGCALQDKSTMNKHTNMKTGLQVGTLEKSVAPLNFYQEPAGPPPSSLVGFQVDDGYQGST